MQEYEYQSEKIAKLLKTGYICRCFDFVCLNSGVAWRGPRH